MLQWNHSWEEKAESRNRIGVRKTVTVSDPIIDVGRVERLAGVGNGSGLHSLVGRLRRRFSESLSK